MSVTRLPKDKIEGNAAKEEIRQCLEIGENKKVAMRKKDVQSLVRLNTKYKIQKTKKQNKKNKIHTTKYKIQNTEYKIPNTKYRTHNACHLCSSDYINYFNQADIDQPKQLCILSATRALHPTSIEAALVLKAASSEDSWHEALDQLVSGGMQRNQADACLKERY